MGRLIDANKLKTDLEKAISKNEDMDCLDFLRASSVIDAHPTAYDFDKVVKELEEWSFNADVNVGDGTIMNQNLITRDNAIEIVKAGRVNG